MQIGIKKIDGVQYRKISQVVNTDRHGIIQFHTDVDKECPVSLLQWMSPHTSQPTIQTTSWEKYIFPGPGTFEVCLADQRTYSPTFGNRYVMICGERHPVVLDVPPEVVLSYSNISEKDGVVLFRSNPFHQSESLCSPQSHPLKKKGWQWAIAVLTSNWRSSSTLQRTLESFRGTGFDPPVIFSDLERKCDIWNWHRAMSYLVKNYPDADAYAIIEDDVIFSKNIREYLENNLWPSVEEEGCLCSLFTPTRYTSDETWHKINLGYYTWMSQFRIYHPRTAHKIIHDVPELADFHSGERQNDEVIGKWLEKHDVGIWYHNPSLVQHTGLNMTNYDLKIEYGVTNGLTRNFVGENLSVSDQLPDWVKTRKPFRKISFMEIPVDSEKLLTWTKETAKLFAQKLDQFNCDIDRLYFIVEDEGWNTILNECVDIIRLTGKVHHIGLVSSQFQGFDPKHFSEFQSYWLIDPDHTFKNETSETRIHILDRNDQCSFFQENIGPSDESRIGRLEISSDESEEIVWTVRSPLFFRYDKDFIGSNSETWEEFLDRFDSMT